MPDLTVTSGVLNAMAEAARRAAPNESCGLLLGSGRHIREARACANVAPDPRRHFEIDPGALIAAHKAERAGGDRLFGYYHSHPAGPAAPSDTDAREAARDGRIWAIVAVDGAIGWFVSGPCGFEPIVPAIDP